MGTRPSGLEWGLYGFIVLVGALMRFWDLGSRALHHDESLHATYSWYLWERLTGTNLASNPEYHYDPMMHGPYQFHGNALMYLIFGPSEGAARLNAALCGTVLIALPFLLRRQFGRVSALILSALLAFSPAFLYYSRFTREDIYFALFIAVFFIGLLRWLDARGRPNSHRWLYMTAAGFALCWATKESTFFILLPILLGFLLLVVAAGYAYQFLTPRRSMRAPHDRQSSRGGRGQAVAPAQQPAQPPAHPLVQALGDFSRANLPALIGAVRGVPALAWLACLAIIAAITVVLFWPVGDPVSWGFIPFANPNATTTLHTGVTVTYSTDGFFGGVQYWFLQQGEARGTQPWYYYFLVISLYEQVGVVFGAAGLVYYVLHRRTRLSLISGGLFVVFTLLTLFLGPTLPKALYELLALLMIVSGVVLLLSRPRSPLINFLLWWTVTTWGLYTLAGEKMPWLTVHIMLPTYMVAALYLGHLFTARRLSRTWIIALVGLALTAAISFRSSVALAYADGANPTEMLIYVQTAQDVPAASAVVHALTQQGTQQRVWMDRRETWPWVWYLRDEPYALGGNGADAATDADAGAVLGAARSRYDALLVGWPTHDYLRDHGRLRGLAGYTAYGFKLRWWFPEGDYKAWETTGVQGFLGQAIQPSSWGRLVAWWAARTPFNQADFDNWANVESFYVYIRNDLVPRAVPRTDFWAAARRRAVTTSVSASSVATNDVPEARTTPVHPLLSIAGATAPRPLSVVRAVAVGKGGVIYVTDSVAQRVARFDAAGHEVAVWGSAGAGPGEFGNQSQGPMGIAVGPKGQVYVADTWNHRVQEFTRDGTFVRAFGRPNPATGMAADSLFGPRQLAVAPNGNIYVADTGNERIAVYSPTGRRLFNIGAGSHGPETALGRFDEPSGVAVDAHGVVYVADYWDRRIQRFTLAGAPIGPAFAVAGWPGTLDYGEPYLAVDDKGHLFATDAPQNNAHVPHVLELNAATGRLPRAFGVASGQGALQAPSGLAVGPDGALYIADVGSATLLKVRP